MTFKQATGAPQPGPFPMGYFEAKSYFDKDGHMIPSELHEWPQWIAGTFYQEKMASTQLRRFFDRVRSIQRDLMTSRDFDATRERILALKPLAAYAVGRETAPPDFKRFIDRNTDLALKDETSFKRGFVLHFQGVVAYLKYEEATKGKRGR